MINNYQIIPIVKINPVDPAFVISWHIHDRCNFDCMYCPDKWHNLDSNTKSLGELQKCWLEIYNKTKHRNLKYKIGLTGGEVTLNHDLLDFLKWLEQNYKDYIQSIGIVTNGTASQKLYADLVKYLNWISFSTHSEFFNEEKFFQNVVSVKQIIENTNKTVHVNIMDEPWHLQRIEIYKRFLTKLNINFSISEIDWSLQIRPIAKINPNKNLFKFDDYL